MLLFNISEKKKMDKEKGLHLMHPICVTLGRDRHFKSVFVSSAKNFKYTCGQWFL